MKRRSEKRQRTRWRLKRCPIVSRSKWSIGGGLSQRTVLLSAISAPRHGYTPQSADRKTHSAMESFRDTHRTPLTASLSRTRSRRQWTGTNLNTEKSGVNDGAAVGEAGGPTKNARWGPCAVSWIELAVAQLPPDCLCRLGSWQTLSEDRCAYRPGRSSLRDVNSFSCLYLVVRCPCAK